MTFVSDAPRPSSPIAHNDHYLARRKRDVSGNAILTAGPGGAPSPRSLCSNGSLCASASASSRRASRLATSTFPVDRPDLECSPAARPARASRPRPSAATGMTGPGVLLGDLTAGEALVQAAGSGWRIAAGSLQRLAELDRPSSPSAGPCRRALRQVMGAVSYSGRATIVERLARWLSQAAQRLDSGRLVITHDTWPRSWACGGRASPQACRCWKAGI